MIAVTQMAAMPSPPQMAAPGQGVSKTKTGLLVAGIGLIINGLGAFVGLLSLVGGIVALAGAAWIFTGRTAFPGGHKGNAAAGLGLMALAYILGIIAFVFLFQATTSLATQGTSVDLTAILAALRTAVLVGFGAGVVWFIGVFLLPWRLLSGAAKGIVAAGLALGLLGWIVLFALVYFPLAGAITDVAQILAILAGVIVGGVIILIANLLSGIGYIVARGKIPAAAAM